jgi:uncharacterized membrane protein
MIDFPAFFTILAMSVVTYATRVSGYLLLRKRMLSPRMTKVLETIPGCVLIAVIAPAFATNNITNLIAVLATLLLATRFSLLPAVVGSIAITALLRYFLFF